MPWLNELLENPARDSTSGRADALHDALDASDISPVFSARLAGRLGRSWACAEDLVIQLDRCITAVHEGDKEEVLVTLVRGRDSGSAFRREIRGVLETWHALEETSPDLLESDAPANQPVLTAVRHDLRSSVEERIAGGDVRSGLVKIGCPDEIAYRFAEDLHDLFHELAAFLSYVQQLASGPHDPAECRDLLYKIVEPWDPRLVSHGAWHLGFFEDDDQGLYRPGILGWSLAIMDYLHE